MDTIPSDECDPAREQGLDKALPNRAQDRFDKESFKQIFRDHWNDFTAAHPRYDTPYYDRVIAKMLHCGDPTTMGFAQYRCFSCGEARKIAFSCKSCFCLSCAKVYADQWVEFIGRRLCPGVVYRHIVLTVPDYLRLWFYRQPELLSPLMRAGHACLREVFRTCSHGDLDIGSVIVLQTNGRPGNYNPHLHILVPAGGLDPQGRWKTIRCIPFDLLHRTWQYHLLTMLREQIDDPHIEPDLDHGFTHYPKGFVANVQPGDVPPGGKGLADYLAKYLVSPPISVHRIERYDGHTVTYWYRDHRTQAIPHETLPVLRFLGRMVQHILPTGFHRIRYYGLHSHRHYDTVRHQLAARPRADGPTDPRGYRVVPRKPFAQRFTETFGTDPRRCPMCGDTMDLALIYHPTSGILYDVLASGWEAPHEPTARASPDRLRRPVDRTQHLVQLPLPDV